MIPEQSNVYTHIIKKNRRLSKQYIWENESQRVTVIAFANQFLWCPRLISVCAILSTRDNKFLACLRKNSFVFTEIIRTHNMVRKKRLFLKYSDFLRKSERKFLREKLSLSCEEPEKEHDDVIFPGGLPRPGEDVALCLSRELKEETNIDSKFVFLDTRFFVYALIEDLLIDRSFEAIFFLGDVDLSSSEILSEFSSNNEIKSLIFIDSLGEGLESELVRYVLSISRLKCYGNKGEFRYSLRDQANESLKTRDD